MQIILAASTPRSSRSAAAQESQMLIEWIIRILAVIGFLTLLFAAWGIYIHHKSLEGYE